MSRNLKTRATDDVLQEITQLQNRQKRVRYTTDEWQGCSKTLRPLFAEIARRQNEGAL